MQFRTVHFHPFFGAMMLVALFLGPFGEGHAQQRPAVAPGATLAPLTAPPGEALASLRLSATFAADQGEIGNGLYWRVFLERAESNGSHRLVAESDLAAPSFQLPSGNYVVHAAYGLAGAAKRVALEVGGRSTEKIALNAGGIRLVGMLGEAELPGNRLSISVFVPEGNNPEGKLVARNLRGNETLRLPEGTYHVVSTYLDLTGLGSTANVTDAPLTNSVVSADVKVVPGKVTVATFRHRAAQITLKLVNSAGAEALANTSFTILTPGGDVLRELIGAFPSLVLGEGEYVAIARRDGRTYQSTFRVETAGDRDVEILARNTP
jgi:hypothetical protein